MSPIWVSRWPLWLDHGTPASSGDKGDGSEAGSSENRARARKARTDTFSALPPYSIKKGIRARRAVARRLSRGRVPRREGTESPGRWWHDDPRKRQKSPISAGRVLCVE